MPDLLAPPPIPSIHLLLDVMRFPVLWALCLSVVLSPLPIAAQDADPAPRDTTWRVFAPGVVSLDNLRETSPSVTTDGQTLVFARTENWGDKVPYIATQTGADGEGWSVQNAPFADTLYNLAITPDGQSIFFKANEEQDGEQISRVYRVDRMDEGWSDPQNLPSLFNINAGYFCPMADGTLYFFARGPEKPGIYRSEPDGSGTYGAPEWVSDAVSPDGTTSFDVLVHPDEDRLLITRAGIPDDQADALGPRGIYLYRRTEAGWQEEDRLDLPYAWGATVLPDGRLLFVDAGDLQTVSLRSLGVEW